MNRKIFGIALVLFTIVAVGLAFSQSYDDAYRVGYDTGYADAYTYERVNPDNIWRKARVHYPNDATLQQAFYSGYRAGFADNPRNN